MRRIAIVLVGGLLAVVAAACSTEDIAEDAIERAGGGDVDIETGGDVPDCFPDDTPVPDGQVQGGIGVGEGTTAVCSFIVDVNGSTADVIADYRAELEDAGYSVGFELTQPGQEAFGASKGDVGLLVGSSQTGGTTSVSITAGTADIAGTPEAPG